jgi:hypothetical protein
MAYPEYDPNEPSLGQTFADLLRGMSKKQSYQELGQGIRNVAKVTPSVVESLGRGALVQLPAFAGDTSQFARQFIPETMQNTFGNRTAPTSEELLAKIPRINPDYQGSQQHEMVGGLVSPAIASILRTGAKVTKGLKGGLSIENVDSMKIAQQNAALPYSEGGLNLPSNNTPMQRARAMGFETAPSKEIYHGTKEELLGNIDPRKSDLAFHAGTLEQAQERLKTFGKNGVNYPEGSNIVPLLKSKYADFLNLKDEGSFHTTEMFDQLKKNKNLDQGAIRKLEQKFLKDERPYSNEIMNEYNDVLRNLITQQGYKGIKYLNNTEGEGMSYGIIDPTVIRSRFAAFDPKRASEANILAGGLAIPTSGITIKEQLEEQFNKIKK